MTDHDEGGSTSASGPADEPELSVVILTRNRSQMLQQALASVLGQRSVELEALVVDNGSTDPGALDVAGIDDPRVRVLQQDRNHPVAEARNIGLRAARGRWIGFLDDDDLWSPTKARAQIDAAQAAGRSWVYCGVVDVDRDLTVLRGEPALPATQVQQRLPVRNEVPGGCSGVIAERDLVLDLGGMDAAFQFAADWDLWLRLSRVGPPADVEGPHVAYRMHGANMSRHLARMLDELDRFDAKHAVGEVALDRASLIRDAGTQDLLGGHRSAAAGNYLRALRGGDRRARLLLLTVLLPRQVDRKLRRRRSDPNWVATAERWLQQYRTAPRSR